METSRVISPGAFEPEQHYYSRVMNAQIHPLVRYFFHLGNERIIERYCHMHPEAKPEAVVAALTECTKHFRWGGSDLFVVTTEQGDIIWSRWCRSSGCRIRLKARCIGLWMMPFKLWSYS
jgi:hypothetical protein